MRDAVSICNFDPPDVIISDAEMPDGGARNLLKFLRVQGMNPAVAILTGRENDEKAAEYIGLGAARVFIKPAELSEMARWIEDAARHLTEMAALPDKESEVA